MQISRLLLQTPIVNGLTVYIDAKVTFVATNTNGEQIDSFTSIVNRFTVYIAEKIMYVPADTNSQSQSFYVTAKNKFVYINTT